MKSDVSEGKGSRVGEEGSGMTGGGGANERRVEKNDWKEWR